jgi:hypothetical protein
MRLINAETMLLEDFSIREVPHYAILSHTWTEEEVTLQEFTNQNSGTAKKRGFAKIAQTCKLARENHIKYAWVDTCCIDKTSSAELTEAINSMFQWYKNSSVCFAYLSDFPQKEDERMSDWPADRDTGDVLVISYDGLLSCRWFTRGWTLQELIAPRTVRFYDETWNFRGTKESYTDQIHLITHINPLVLRDSGYLAKLSIAERMTWASGRKTTRAEDAAYCLLGLFDISMPLLYGEGDKSFVRLQHEIIRNNNDLSIFGWSLNTGLVSPAYRPGFGRGCRVDCGHRNQYQDDLHSVLARSINECVVVHTWYILDSAEHTVTNRGIKISCSLLEMCLQGCDFYECRCCSDCRAYVLPIGHTDSESRLGIILKKLGPDNFARSNKRLIHLDRNARLFASSTRHRPIYLLTQTPHSMPRLTYLSLKVRKGSHFIINFAAPDDRWNSSERCWYLEKESNQDWGMVSLEFSDLGDRGKICVLFCGLVVVVLDSQVFRREIGLVSQSSSLISSYDVLELFDLRNRNKKTAGDEKQEVMAKMGNPVLESWALEVWTAGSDSGESPSAGNTVSNLVAFNSSESKDTGHNLAPHHSSQLPRPIDNPASSLAGSRLAASASPPAYDPSDSVPAVIVRCKADIRNLPRWSATSIPAHHPVFSQTVPPIPELIEVPLVIHRVDTQTSNRADLDNQIATYLNIDEDSGFAPPYWQSYVGTVIVARKDRKTLLPQHLEGVWQYCHHILDLFGDGDGAPTRLYNRQAFEKWWKKLCDERKLHYRDEWENIKSPYDI